MNWREQVGKLVTPDGESAWRVIGYCAEPTVMIEHCETKERINTGISGLLAQGWMRLIPDGKDCVSDNKKEATDESSTRNG